MADKSVIATSVTPVVGNHTFVPPDSDWNLGTGTKPWNVGYFGSIVASEGIPAGTAATGGDKIGQIRFSINPNIEAGYLALNGQEVSREDYADLWNWVQQQVGFYIEESEWQELSAAHNGNVGKYSLGDGSTTFRLPNLDASLSNPIYGNSDTVQPESIVGIWLVKAYHVPTTELGDDVIVNGVSTSSSGIITLDYSIYTSAFNGFPHNSIFRGKNWGTFSSLADFEAFLTAHEVSSGNFVDLYLGDYFKIQDGTYNGTWMIAGFDTELNKGDDTADVPNVTKHHLTLIPRIPLFNAQMNSGATTNGGYTGSAMHTTTLPAVATALQTVLGSHLIQRRVLLSTSVNTSSYNRFGTTGGASSGWAWTNAYCTLMSEVQVYGSISWSSAGYDVGEACNQLPVFHFIDHIAYSRWCFWLRGVASSSSFCVASYSGDASYHSASNSVGVRPLICVG